MSTKQHLTALGDVMDQVSTQRHASEHEKTTLAQQPQSMGIPAFTADSPLYYKPYGACGTVTGSCHFLFHAPTSKYVAIDCGKLQEGSDESFSPDAMPVRPEQVSALFITHAHTDHIGNLLEWLRAGFRGVIYCTKVTAELTKVALSQSTMQNPQPEDSQALLDLLDGLIRCPDAMSEAPLGKSMPVEGVAGLHFSMHPTSHLIGCVAIRFTAHHSGIKDASILFSGDIGPVSDAATHGGLAPALTIPEGPSDIVVLESTYGDKAPKQASEMTWEARLGRLAKIIGEAAAHGQGATLIIPAFTLGRTTDVLCDLMVVLGSMRGQAGLDHAARPRIQLHSPLAAKFAEVVRDSLFHWWESGGQRWLNDKARILEMLGPDTLRRLLSPSELPRQTHKTADGEIEVVWGPCEPGDEFTVMLAGSGTTLHGEVQRMIMRKVNDTKATVALVGYCPEYSLGAQLRRLVAGEVNQGERIGIRLKDGPKGRARTWDVDADEVQIKLEDASYYYSGHADIQGLIRYAINGNPRQPPVDIILVHGNDHARSALSTALYQNTHPAARKVRAVHTPSSTYPWFDVANRRWHFPDLGELRTSMVITAQENDVFPPTAIRVANGIAKAIARNYPEIRPKINGGIAECDLMLIGLSNGDAVRHLIKVAGITKLDFEVSVKSSLGDCQNLSQFINRCFPWESVFSYLKQGMIGYRPIGKPDEVAGIINEINNPSRGYPLFLMTKLGENNLCAKFISKQLAPRNARSYLVVFEGRDLAADHGLTIRPATGYFYPPDPSAQPLEFSMANPLEVMPQIIAQLNLVEDANQRYGR
jgi:metallo-beta-lactamase family protein